MFCVCSDEVCYINVHVFIHNVLCDLIISHYAQAQVTFAIFSRYTLVSDVFIPIRSIIITLNLL